MSNPITIIISTITTFFVLLSCNNSHKTTDVAVKYSPVIHLLIDSIIESGVVEDEFIGEDLYASLQYKRYKKLTSMASSEQLIDLTNHSNTTVRCYAFQALASTHSDSTFSILLKHLTDTALVTVLSGCEGWNEMVCCYYLDVVAPNYIDNSLYKLNETQEGVISRFVNENSKLPSCVTQRFNKQK